MLLTSVAFFAAARTLARRRVLVQELSAVEGLARIDVMAVDKTGTLTEGDITVDHIERINPTVDAESALGALAVSGDANATLRAIGRAFPRRDGRRPARCRSPRPELERGQLRGPGHLGALRAGAGPTRRGPAGRGRGARRGVGGRRAPDAAARPHRRRPRAAGARVRGAGGRHHRAGRHAGLRVGPSARPPGRRGADCGHHRVPHDVAVGPGHPSPLRGWKTALVAGMGALSALAFVVPVARPFYELHLPPPLTIVQVLVMGAVAAAGIEAVSRLAARWRSPGIDLRSGA